MATGKVHGTAYLTTSGAIGTGTGPIVVYAIHVISGGTASVVQIKNAGTGGTIYLQETGTLSKGVTFNYSEGFYIPSTAFYTADGNQTSVTISYDQIA